MKERNKISSFSFFHFSKICSQTSLSAASAEFIKCITAEPVTFLGTPLLGPATAFKGPAKKFELQLTFLD